MVIFSKYNHDNILGLFQKTVHGVCYFSLIKHFLHGIKAILIVGLLETFLFVLFCFLMIRFPCVALTVLEFTLHTWLTSNS